MLLKAESKYPCDLILFGTLGDLSCRKLLPALYQLELANLLHEKQELLDVPEKSWIFLLMLI